VKTNGKSSVFNGLYQDLVTIDQNWSGGRDVGSIEQDGSQSAEFRILPLI
jgi:hypothetical protein